MSGYKRFKQRTYEVLEGTRFGDRTSQIVHWFIITLIVLNVAAIVMSTVEPLKQDYREYFRWFEIVSVVIFTIEYVLRVWAITESDEYNRPVVGRLRFMVTPGALIDLVAILPFYLPWLTDFDLRGIRSLRLFRLFRLLKIGRYSKSMTIFGDVLRDKRQQVGLAFVAVVIVLVFVSSLMYFAEMNAQPDKFGSIPEAMWWGVITLTTVGYGDVYPVTTIGKVLGGIISLLGIGLFALPAGILASGFEEAVNRREKLRHGDDEEEDEEDEGAAKEAEDEAQNGSGESDAEHRYCPCCGQLRPEYRQEAESREPRAES